MCGLVGAAGRLFKQEISMFQYLLKLDTVRGPHSTGICAVDSKGEVNVFKEVGTPWEAECYKEYDEVFKPNLKVLIGHNRFATVGKVNSENAHPFEFDKLVGAHNGTLIDQDLLDDSDQFDVDSENLYYHMNKKGVEDTAKNLHGAFALTWWDKVNKSINFLRNSKRPLIYVYSKDGKTIFWASELWMLEVAAKKYNVALDDTFWNLNPLRHMEIVVDLETYLNPLGEPAVTSVKEWVPTYPKRTAGFLPHGQNTGKTTNNVYQFGAFSKTDSDLRKLIGKRMEVRLSHTVTFRGESYIVARPLDEEWKGLEIRVTKGVNSQALKEHIGNFHSVMSVKIRRLERSAHGNHRWLVAKERDTVLVEAEPEEKKFLGWEGVELEEVRWRAVVSHGCSWCSGTPSEEDGDNLHWLSSHEFLCPDCKDNKEVRQLVGAY